MLSVTEALCRSLYSPANASSIGQARVSRPSKQVAKWAQFYPAISLDIIYPCKIYIPIYPRMSRDNFTRWPSDFGNFVSGVEKNINKLYYRYLSLTKSLNQHPIKSFLVSVIMDFIVMQLIGITSSNDKINLPFREVSFFFFFFAWKTQYACKARYKAVVLNEIKT